MKYTLKNTDIAAFNDVTSASFPKYTSQLMNLANQNAQGTRPVVVGNMSELFPEYLLSANPITLENWRSWYLERNPNTIDTATDKIFAHVQNLRTSIAVIDREMVRRWVEDLVIDKTYNGMYFQKAILASLAEKKGVSYRLATPAEESIGIDGYVGEIPYSVKPDTYRTMNRLSERIDVKMIYYKKTKTGLKLEIED